MSKGFHALLLILAICSMAVVLALLVHERNMQISEEPALPTPAKMEVATATHGVTATIEPQQATSTPVGSPSAQPAVSPTPVAATSTLVALTPPPHVYKSDDGVAQAWLENDPVLSSPFVFHGTGTAFESQMMWRLRDAKRKVLGEGYFMVRSPDVGIPGPFDVTGKWETNPTTTSGTLYIFESSAKDGAPIHIVSIPVRFATSTSL